MGDEKAGELERARAALVKAGLRVTGVDAACGERGSGRSRVQAGFWPGTREPWTVLVGDPPGPSIIGRGVSLQDAVTDARGVADMVLEHESKGRSKAATKRAVELHRVQVAALQELMGLFGGAETPSPSGE